MNEALALSPYELVLAKAQEGKIDPFDIDLDYLISLFRETAKELEAGEYLIEAGRFLEASAKLMKLQVEEIFPKPKPERKKVTIEQVKEVLAEEEQQEAEYDMEFIYSYTPKIGRPSGAKDKVERKLSWKEFWDIAQKDIREVLHEQIDYRELAEEVRGKVLRGEPIRTLREFIAYLHAYMEFDDVPELPELFPAVGTKV